MSVVEIRVGQPKVVEHLREVRTHWPAGPPCAYIRDRVDGPVEVTAGGLAGNGAGFPSHIEDARDRTALVFNELTYDMLLEEFPQCRETLIRGGFAENFVVTSPELLPSVVCIGDVFRVGSALFEVSGPRFPCPKVDAWHNTSGLKAKSLENGWSGYFLRVSGPGVCTAGDEMVLVSRPHPGFTVERICRSLWGPEAEKDNSVEFLSYVVNDLPQLMERRFRDTARTRLQRQLDGDCNE